MQKVIQEAAKDFVKFVNRGPSPYHGTLFDQEYYKCPQIIVEKIILECVGSVVCKSMYLVLFYM